MTVHVFMRHCRHNTPVKTNLHGDCIYTPREKPLSRRWSSSKQLHMRQIHGASSNGNQETAQKATAPLLWGAPLPRASAGQQCRRQQQMTPSCTMGCLDQRHHARPVQGPVRKAASQSIAGKSSTQTTHLHPTSGIQARTCSMRRRCAAGSSSGGGRPCAISSAGPMGTS